MKEHSKLFIYLAVSVTGFFWGISFLATSLLIDAGAEPIQIQACRWLIASLAFLSLIVTGKVRIDIHKPQFKFLILAGILEPCIYMIFENYGIKYSNSSISSIFIATIPCFALLINTVVFKHHTSRQGVISILVAFAGVAICTVFSPGFTTGGDIKGYAFLMGAVLAAALYGINNARLGGIYDAVEITTIMSFVGLSFFTFLNFAMGYGMKTYALMFGTPRMLMGIIFLGLFCSALCFMFMNKVIIMLDDPALGNNMTSSVTTVVGALAGILIGGDPAGIYTIVGLSLTVLGVFLTSRATRDML